ncbi:MAG TPA: hypothetical protein VJ752_19585 [Burkholderiaceae bacterium]|nr:hypothetical protein [Burkholderiaceae bacterium]
MTATIVDLPVGAQLEREIDGIEAQDHDAVLRATIAKRVEIAKAKLSTLQSHEAVFSASKARLMARLTGRDDA